MVGGVVIDKKKLLHYFYANSYVLGRIETPQSTPCDCAVRDTIRFYILSLALSAELRLEMEVGEEGKK